MKISIFASVLLLSAALLFLGPETADAHYSLFEFKHIVSEMNPDECNGTMNAKKMKETNSMNCKHFNTFIVRNNKRVKAACRNNEGRETERTTLYSFPVVDCTTTDRKPFPCDYTGATGYGRIVVICKGLNPIHLKRVIPQ